MVETKERLSTVKLIREEFAGVTMHEIKALTETDRVQLASAIARDRKLTTEQLAFTPVEY